MTLKIERKKNYEKQRPQGPWHLTKNGRKSRQTIKHNLQQVSFCSRFSHYWLKRRGGHIMRFYCGSLLSCGNKNPSQVCLCANHSVLLSLSVQGLLALVSLVLSCLVSCLVLTHVSPYPAEIRRCRFYLDIGSALELDFATQRWGANFILRRASHNARMTETSKT